MNHRDTETQSASVRRRRNATRAGGACRPAAQAGRRTDRRSRAAPLASSESVRLCVSVSLWLIVSVSLILSASSGITLIS